jgi:son of sevenless-like protein
MGHHVDNAGRRTSRARDASPARNLARRPQLASEWQNRSSEAPNALLGPGGGHGGNWRSNGFTLLPTPTASTSSSIPHLDYAYPSQQLNAQSLEQIKKAQTEVADEVANLKGAIAGVVAQSSRRASVISTRSHLSDASGGASNASTSYAAPLSVPATAAKHLPKISTQSLAIARKLSALLLETENLDLASQLDLDFDPADVKALLDYAAPKDKGKGKATEQCEQESAYRETISQARQALANLEATKQNLYSLHANVLLAIQDIALSELNEHPSSKAHIFAHSQAQPSAASPLNDFHIMFAPADPLNAFQATLAPLDGHLSSLSLALSELLSIVEKQSGVPQEMRVTSEQARARISMQRLSQLSFKSSAYLDRDDASVTGTVTNISRAKEFRETPPSSNASDSGMEEKLFYTQPTQPYDRVRNSGTSQRTPDRDYAESMRSEDSSQYASQGLGLHVSKRSVDVSDEDSESGNSPVTRSPSNNKLRKIFGENVPVTVSGNLPEFLQGDYNDELSFTMDGLVKGGTLRALVARLTSHELG